MDGQTLGARNGGRSPPNPVTAAGALFLLEVNAWPK
jgi:hypothetical protein